jgi:predicted lactoylglutathione lyase
MAKMIFVNLPVTDVGRATAFYEAIGFARNPQFSNDQASCMVWSDTIHAMLLRHDFYATFAVKPIADTHAVSAAILCLSRDSRAEVDAISAAAKAAGGRTVHDPEENGFMYGAAFEDPDGHTFEAMFMDMDAARQAMDAAEPVAA